MLQPGESYSIDYPSENGINCIATEVMTPQQLKWYKPATYRDNGDWVSDGRLLVNPPAVANKEYMIIVTNEVIKKPKVVHPITSTIPKKNPPVKKAVSPFEWLSSIFASKVYATQEIPLSSPGSHYNRVVLLFFTLVWLIRYEIQKWNNKFRIWYGLFIDFNKHLSRFLSRIYKYVYFLFTSFNNTMKKSLSLLWCVMMCSVLAASPIFTPLTYAAGSAVGWWSIGMICGGETELVSYDQYLGTFIARGAKTLSGWPTYSNTGDLWKVLNNGNFLGVADAGIQFMDADGKIELFNLLNGIGAYETPDATAAKPLQPASLLNPNPHMGEEIISAQSTYYWFLRWLIDDAW
jgi:hypothetical protein